MDAGRYEIVGTLGQGGMARVLRARDRTLGREVALKLLDGRADEHLVARFAREGRAIARLDHPGCVRVLDSGPRHLVMELVPGETLADRLEASGALDEATAVRIARGMLAALAHAHARGVLHRDLKPSNIMLAGARVVVIDFGLACIHDEAAMTGAGTCAGSPSYLAPERLLGCAYDERADIYAVGVVLYEMLTGTRPFVGNTLEQIMEQAITRPPRPLRAVRPEISKTIEAVVTRALAKDPMKRFADAEEMRSALEPPAPPPERDPATSSTTALIVARSWWARLWSRVRYGRWRWT